MNLELTKRNFRNYLFNQSIDNSFFDIDLKILNEYSIIYYIVDKLHTNN